MLSNNYLSIYAKSFNWAGFFLPKKTYFKCSALYDFCRTIDNIADDNNLLNTKKEKLSNFKRKFHNKNYDDSIIKNMWKLIDEYNLSTKIIDDLFDGVETDLQEKVEFISHKELLVYSYRVAGTVGLMMAKILNVKNNNALKSAIDLGIAMQLTNISRDVIQDANNNRNYIDGNFDSIKKTLKLADTFYESSFSSIREIPIFFRFSILVARRVYREIGNFILKKTILKIMKNREKYMYPKFIKFFKHFWQSMIF